MEIRQTVFIPANLTDCWLGGRGPVLVQILRKQFPGLGERAVHVMRAHQLVEIHSDVLVVKLGPHYVVSVLMRVK